MYFYSIFHVLITFILVIHPYYKLNWIELHWGGAATQAEAIKNGDKHARNWVDEAEKLVEATVCSHSHFIFLV